MSVWLPDQTEKAHQITPEPSHKPLQAVLSENQFRGID